MKKFIRGGFRLVCTLDTNVAPYVERGVVPVVIPEHYYSSVQTGQTTIAQVGYCKTFMADSRRQWELSRHA